MASPAVTSVTSAPAGPAGDGVSIRVRGACQGVGFRPWVLRTARALGVAGSVRNTASGVAIEAFGPPAALEALRRALAHPEPPGARVDAVEVRPMAARRVDGFRIDPSARRVDGFRIDPSVRRGRARASLVPDLPACDACLAEMRAPRDRRFGYALLTCCSCGPRYTLARALPFDRAATGMADFPACAACREEYADLASRRFHAQTLSCPRCGPRLRLLDQAGREVAGDPVAEAARTLGRGAVVAIKGVGGFHLACDAANARAVARLRRSKRRDAKPFAVMVRDLAAAERLGRVGPTEAELLRAPERPVVLLRPSAAADTLLAPEVTSGSPLLGLLLPYTPLHHALLERAPGPLVMTSANASGDPLARDDAEARARLAGAADLWLTHDRPIERRCDDSVVRVVGGRPSVARRARGLVPRPVRLPRPVRQPVLACGGAWKNAFALVDGDEAWVSPHVGDLETVDACAAFDEAVADLERLLGIRPRLVVHDLHPAWYPTRYAAARPEPTVAVAHHHAHALSVMAEHGLAGPALALAWDGTGLGPDGAAWGGELLRVEAARFERLATVRPLALPGADRAIREPWRAALAALDDAFAGEPPLDALPLFQALPPERVRTVRQVARSPRLAPRAHGVGRLFDVAAALALDRGTCRYEGESALALEGAACGDVGAEPYPFALAPGPHAPREIDLRGALRAIVADRLAGEPAGRIADRFHATLVAAAEAAVRALAPEDAGLPLVLAGGCFQNDLLVRGLRARLEPAFRLCTARALPPGDGGLALGQAIAGDALARAQGE